MRPGLFCHDFRWCKVIHILHKGGCCHMLDAFHGCGRQLCAIRTRSVLPTQSKVQHGSIAFFHTLTCEILLLVWYPLLLPSSSSLLLAATHQPIVTNQLPPTNLQTTTTNQPPLAHSPPSSNPSFLPALLSPSHCRRDLCKKLLTCGVIRAKTGLQ